MKPLSHLSPRGRKIAILLGITAAAGLIAYAGVAVGPVINSTLEAKLNDTVTADGKATPGETIDLTATITNVPGSPSGAVTYSQTVDANTTLVPGSLKATPLAINDTYACIGNVGIDVPVISGLLANDLDPDGTNGGGTMDLDVAMLNTTGTQGTVALVGTDGAFTYRPKPGFVGADTFSYTVTDASMLGDASTGQGIVSVTINVSGSVWFVNNAAPAGGNGTLTAPFNTLSQQSNNTLDANGDCIFIYSGTGDYNGALNLQASQKLMGQGSTQTVETFCSLTVPAHSLALPMTSGTNPVLKNSAGNALVLSTGNSVRGVNIGETSGTGIVASAFTTATINEVSIASKGQALSMATGALTANFVSITKTVNPLVPVATDTAKGVFLNGVTGSTNLGNLNITSTGAGIGLDIQNSTGVTCAATSVVSTVGTALKFSNSTIGSGGPMVLQSVTSTGGSDPGISLVGVSGALTVSGTGTTAGSGGSITGKSATDAVILSGTNGLVSLKNFNINNISAAADSTAAIGTRSGVDGIHGFNVNGGLSLTNCTITNISDNAISGGTLAVTPAPALWNGLEIRDCLFNNANRFHVTDRGDDSSEGIVYIRGLTGNVVIDNSTLSNGGRGFDVTTPPTAGTLDMTVQRSSITQIFKEFATGGTVNVGNRGISVIAQGTHNAVVRIGDPAQLTPALGNTFTNCATASVVVASQEGGATPHSGTMQVVVSRNTFLVTDHSTSQQAPGNLSFNFPQGGVSINPSGGTHESIVSHNLFNQVMHSEGAFGQLALGHNNGNGTSELIAENNEFRLPWDAAVTLRAEGNANSFVRFANNTYTDGVVGGPTDDLGTLSQSPFQGFLTSVRNSGRQHLRLLNEVLPQQDDVNGGGDYTFVAEVQNLAANTLHIHLDDCKAPDGYRLINSGGTFLNYRENAAHTTPVQVIQGNGNFGGGGQSGVPNPTVNGDMNPAVVSVVGTITATDTPPTAPSITIP